MRNRPKEGLVGPLTVPCGQCIGCKLERSRLWAIRCMHETTLHENSIFVTLTYDDEHLPPNGNLNRPDLQKFFKRLKKGHPNVRRFYCGEYGDQTRRPHYHAILFGYSPDDKQLHRVKSGNRYYVSEKLLKLWKHGHCEFSDVTFETCAYVARYVTKKITGPPAEKHYQRIDPETGEVTQVNPEFSGMSLRPGIGMPFLEKWADDIYSKYEIVTRGVACKPPPAYDRWIKKHRPDLWAKSQPIRHEIIRKAKERAMNPEIHQSRREHAGNKIQTQKLNQNLRNSQ